MDDGLRFRTLIAECVDVGHHIMAEPLFISFRRGEIDVFPDVFPSGRSVLWKSEVQAVFALWPRQSTGA